MVPWVKSKEASKLEEARTGEIIRFFAFHPARHLYAQPVRDVALSKASMARVLWLCTFFCFWLWFGWRDPRVTCPMVMFVRLALATAQLPLHLGLVIPQLESNMWLRMIFSRGGSKTPNVPLPLYWFEIFPVLNRVMWVGNGRIVWNLIICLSWFAK